MKTRICGLFFILSSLFVCCTADKKELTNDEIIEKRNQSNKARTAKVNEKGKQLFQANCAACHHTTKESTGPALKGLLERAPSRQWVYQWVKNPAKVIAAGDPYAIKIWQSWNKTMMTPFPNLSEQDIDDILEYTEM